MITCIFCQAQPKILPKENAVLNYRIVGFSCPPSQGANGYKVEIASGRVSEQNLFHPQVTSKISQSNRVIAEVPHFGQEYTWRMVYTFKNGETANSNLYHFSTGLIPFVDSTRTKLKDVQNKKKYKDLYILFDGANAMFDMEGRPVWYLPALNGARLPANDMKCSPQHSITLLYGVDAIEVNYNGKILWKAPDMLPPGQTTNAASLPYHHEFVRLNNGHYMVLGSDLPDPAANAVRPENNGPPAQKKRRRFFTNTGDGSMLYEFDTSGKTLWSWNSSDYFNHSDIKDFVRDVAEKWQINSVPGHENSFYFDQKERVIYLGISSFNRIIKINYPSGTVTNAYGEPYISNKNLISKFEKRPGLDSLLVYTFNNGMFCGQHTCKKSKDGSLIIYNNNMSLSGIAPQVLILREPANSETDGLKKTWVYDCPVDTLFFHEQNSGGGSASELPDGSLLVSMNSPYNNVFIVNKQKEICWSALPVSKNDKGEWETISSYRTSIVTRRELEQLIWNETVSNTRNE